jgi:hypothetical protein
MLATISPQQAIDRALPMPSECDFTVVIIARRMGTPLVERKLDGSFYRSGTEWEFENARQAGKPILLYRRTFAAPVTEESDESAQQLANVQAFFSQFTTAGGAATGGFTAYRTVDELVSRLRTDIETLLPGLRHTGVLEPGDAIDEGHWTGRVQARLHRWHYGKLLLLLAAGSLLTVVAWTAFSAFSTVVLDHEAPRSAHAVRYSLLIVGVVIPAALFVITWWWFGGNRGRYE